MSRLSLSIALGDYDITRPLLDGAVAPQGVDLVGMTYPSPQRHWRMLTNGEFDIAELSLGSYVAARAAGQEDLVAVPVFPHRRFRHGYLFLPAASPVREAKDLAGTTIGVRSWQTTAGVWLRGILAEHHDLPTDSITWVAQDGEDVPLTLPPGLTLRGVGDGENVVDLCAAGDIEGLIYPELPRQVLAGEPALRRLFADPKRAEQDYVRATGIFPIMHVVAIRAEVLATYPWVARNVMDAFEESKRLAMRRLDNPRTVSLAWLRALQEEEREILGADPWQYGLTEANRNVLAVFLRYAVQQGVAARPLTPAELFHPATVDTPPAYV
jgi:4,5-dihydroxyphthalate decarboxylase